MLNMTEEDFEQRLDAWYEQMRKHPQHWHFRKEITAGHILTTLMLAAALLGVYMQQDAKISLALNGVEKNAQEITHHRELVAQQAAGTRESIQELKQGLKDVRQEIRNASETQSRKLDEIRDALMRHSVPAGKD